ncbi:MAG: AAA family ATPase [Saprospiraceae bacterium]|nr:AAA family ATPase [Saprospiraceae bacterium]
MLKELHIWNYRLFDELTIPDLGQVNLIAGKNNTGKTALLEALRIWAAKGDSTVVNHVLKNRGQFTPSWDESYEQLFNQVHSAMGDNHGKLKINEVVIERHNQHYGKEIEDKTIFIKRIEGMVIPSEFFGLPLDPNVNPDFPKDDSIFVPFSIQPFPLQHLWDKISLTLHEETVLEIMRVIEPGLLRLDLRGDSSKVLLKNVPSPVSLKSLGDGFNRTLWIAVALVSAKDSILLIDEFEAGLHHSVQEMLWEKIFFYAQKWNIQVFVTTHSMDAVRTFFYVSDKLENQGKGKFFRLQQSRKGPIEVIAYDHDRLEKMLELKMEPR